MKKTWLFVILALGFLVRLYRINFPLADWHSWRQADTAAVARNYCQQGIDWFRPRFDDLSNIPSGQDNPQGWRFVEWPIYNVLHCQVYKITSAFIPNFSFEAAGRLTAIFFSLASISLIYLLVKSLSGEKLALLASFFLAVLPFNIYYSRTILPESALMVFSLSWFYFFVVWLKTDRAWSYWLSLASFALALLIKPYVIFFGLPLLYLWWKKDKLKIVKNWQAYLFLGLPLVGFIAWRWWMSHFPEGIPAYLWLLNQNGIRWRPAWFRWLFADRLGRLILGYWGLIPFALGLIVKPGKHAGWFYHWWLAGILVYLSVFATGNVTHDYYQVITLPLICVFLAKGTEFLLKPPKKHFSLIIGYCLLFASLALMLGFSWFYVRDFFNINHPEIVLAGQAADQLLPPEAKVIAPYGGDTAFLYQTNRSGWPIGFEIQDKIDKGATHYVSVNFDEEVNWLKDRCPVLHQAEQFVIIDLQNCSQPLN
ncbi:glycosyltransferase family 39 protein [Patescibacteria group bacterium]|nr:glycosyltransferase family 39 protein [Patescibacteria group bacterium]MBU1931640.1 glycosyltransferase family 39 protein [Patescibacteria group bacterium]